MLRIIIVFLISNLFSQNVENVFYDFSRHQGHTLKRGDLMWNEDWSSNGLFFDGTFSNFSSMYGPQIESNLFKSPSDSLELDSIFTKSYFDYVTTDGGEISGFIKCNYGGKRYVCRRCGAAGQGWGT